MDSEVNINKLLIDYTSPFGAICVSLAMLTLVTLLFLTQLIRLINAYRRKMASIVSRRLPRKAPAGPAAFLIWAPESTIWPTEL